VLGWTSAVGSPLKCAHTHSHTILIKLIKLTRLHQRQVVCRNIRQASAAVTRPLARSLSLFILVHHAHGDKVESRYRNSANARSHSHLEERQASHFTSTLQCLTSGSVCLATQNYSSLRKSQDEEELRVGRLLLPLTN